MLAKPQMPTEIEDPVSPFQMCRMLLDQMGLLSWEKRSGLNCAVAMVTVPQIPQNPVLKSARHGHDIF